MNNITALNSPYWNAPSPRFRDSLAVRLGAVMVIFVTAMTIALYVSIEYFVSKQLRQVHSANTKSRVEEMRLFLASEATHLERMLALAATDSDLIHSAHYHLGLRGQDLALVQDVERVARTFDLARVDLWTADGRLVRGFPANADPESLAAVQKMVASAKAETASAWFWNRGGLWTVAVTRLPLSEGSYAVLSAARPLTGGGLSYPFGSDIRLQPGVKTGELVPGEARLALASPEGGSTWVGVSIPDGARATIDTTQRILVLILGIGGLLLLGAIAGYLYRALAPLRSLAQHAGEVGRGRFHSHGEAQGNDEVAQMVRAFNKMVDDIGRFRALEQRMHHDQRLAAIGRLAAKVAHDINNPLTIIRSTAALLLRRLAPDSVDAADAKAIEENCNRCSHIVENLLQFGQPLRLRLERLELAELAGEAARRAAIRHPSARIRVQAIERVEVLGDRYHLDRVMDNLINNAYQASPGKEIVLETGREDGRGYLAVIDGGTGFSPEAVNHLFEPFFTTKPEGVGLGLASCLAVARAHDGDLNIVDAGRGHVTLWVPGAEPAAESGKTPQAAALT